MQSYSFIRGSIGSFHKARAESGACASTLARSLPGREPPRFSGPNPTSRRALRTTWMCLLRTTACRCCQVSSLGAGQRGLCCRPDHYAGSKPGACDRRACTAVPIVVFPSPVLSVRSALFHLLAQNRPGYRVDMVRSDNKAITQPTDLFFWDISHPYGPTGHRWARDWRAGGQQQQRVVRCRSQNNSAARLALLAPHARLPLCPHKQLHTCRYMAELLIGMTQLTAGSLLLKRLQVMDGHLLQLRRRWCRISAKQH